ncbi:hypothetical protein [Thermus sp. NEB1569]|uniref:hypothetical protein n=1 Tax=Thermus sp. NEB1569 TaxID=2918899 RepID=UPI001EFBE2D3|nr:hypothetical protein [Thermus sp. NEB1569]ULR40000.1 hypothetical protein MI302_07610 [Thermus sp. NEB1569]
MKKVLWGLLGIAALSFGFGQSPGVGFYSGYPTYIGLQYQSANLRLGAGFGFRGVAGDAAFILAKAPLPSSSGLGMSWYYGLGLGASVYMDASGFGVHPHALAGVEVQLPDPAINLYFEGQLGASVLPSSAFSPYFAGRVGVILR